MVVNEERSGGERIVEGKRDEGGGEMKREEEEEKKKKRKKVKRFISCGGTRSRGWKGWVGWEREGGSGRVWMLRNVAV